MPANLTSKATAVSQKPLVLPLAETNKEDIALVGGKGASLGEMTRAGIPVPPGFVVTVQAYQEFIANNRLDEVIEGLLTGVDVENSAALARAAEQIQSIILSSPLPPRVQEVIEEAYKLLGEGPVAVRSSATAEDLPQASFAGQQSTFLNVEGTGEVLRAVRACWASLYEARAIFYRETAGYNHQEVSIAVPLQRMVDAEVSGVLFTADPNTGSRDRLVIEAIYGLSEPLVSGQLSPDLAVVDKATLRVISYQPASQPWALLHSRNGHGFQRGTARHHIPAVQQSVPKLSGEQMRKLVLLGLKIEQHYGCPQDIEWALAEGQLYIVQSRPITTLETAQAPIEFNGHTGLSPILTGSPASPGIGAGPVKVIKTAAEIPLVQPGDVLVAEMTTPDFVPAMKRTEAIVTERGGRTCHAAIVSREMGIPCVVGAGDATQVLAGVPMVTVDGGTGRVYRGDLRGLLQPAHAVSETEARLKTRTRLYVNLADPEAAGRVAAMDVDGVGLLRPEFIMAHIGEHPRAMLDSGRGTEFTQRLAQGLENFARAFAPRPVVYRFSDFKTNEYRNLKGGEEYEPQEENPMLGYRGCARYLAEPDLFDLEVQVVKETRERFSNLWVMLPFVRTINELRSVKKMLEGQGLRSDPSFKLWMMLEVPSNVLLLDQFLDVGVDGVSIGSNDLTQLILGVDRDSERLAALFDERDPAAPKAVQGIIPVCTHRSVTVSICGQGPSVYPDLTRQLVFWGIDSVSVSPDMVQQTRQIIHDAEMAEMG